MSKIFSSYNFTRFRHFCLVSHNSVCFIYLVGHIPSRPITMLCHIRPDNNCQIDAEEFPQVLGQPWLMTDDKNEGSRL